MPTLTARQIGTLAAIGAVYWLVAAILTRLLAPAGWLDGDGWTVLLYLAVYPGTVPFLVIGMRIAGLPLARSLEGVGVMTAAAATLDGIALVWAPGLYSLDPVLRAASGAVILWGAGAGLFLALLIGRRAS